MLVPEIVLVAVFDEDHAALIAEPGAMMSTQRPLFEKLDSESERVELRQIIGSYTRAYTHTHAQGGSMDEA